MILDEKIELKVGFVPGISWSPDWRPKKHGYRGLIIGNAIFDKLIQFLSNSKVAKAELFLIGGYHNKWLELTYYIETLTLRVSRILQVKVETSTFIK